jgi:hypothetical protein
LQLDRREYNSCNTYAHQPNIELVNKNQLTEGARFSKETHLQKSQESIKCRIAEKWPCGDRRISDVDSVLRQTLPYPNRWRVLFPVLLFPFYVHQLTAIGRGRDARTAIYGAELFLRGCASKLLAEVTCMNTTTTTPASAAASTGGARASWTLVYLLFVPRIVLHANLWRTACGIKCSRREHAQQGHERSEEALDAPTLQEAVRRLIVVEIRIYEFERVVQNTRVRE